MSMPALLKGRLSIPAIGAPLFIISVPDLVIAQCKAGIVGSFPALNARPPELLDEWLVRIKQELAAHDRTHPDRPSAPFAVNQIVHKSNARLEEDMALMLQWKGPKLLTSVAAGAGGQPGSISPFALIQDIRAWFDGALLLSGAIATGRAVLAAQVMGADLAYIGTAFVATPEARAIDDYKEAIVDGDASDIVGSTYFTGVFGNYLRPSIVKSGLDPDGLPEREAKSMSFAGASSSASEAKAWRGIWG